MATIVSDLISHIQAGETLSVNDAIYISSADGKAYRLDVTAPATATFAGITKDAAVLNDYIRVVQAGRIKGFTGLTAGAFVYASTTVPGSFQLTEPVATQKLILGIAKSSTELILNGALSAQGSGGAAGGGGLDTFFTDDFSITQSTDFTTGNNATFLGAGALVGTLADETVSPIAGSKSIKYTQALGSLNDYVASKVIDLELKQKDNWIHFHTAFTYSGNNDDIAVVIYDVTNGAVLSSSVDLLPATNSVKIASIAVYVPATCNQIRYGFQVTVENIGAVLIFDDVELKQIDLTGKNIYRESYHLSQPTSGFLNLDSEIEYNLATATISSDATGFSVVDDPANTRTRINILRNGTYTIIFGLYVPPNRPSSIALDGTIVATGSYDATGNASSQVSYKATLNAGQFITFGLSNGAGTFIGASPSATQISYLTVVAEYESESLVTVAKENLTDWTSYTPTFTGFGTPSSVNFLWRRNGDTLEVQGAFTAGTVSATTAKITFPSGLVADSAAYTRIQRVGDASVQNLVNADDEITVLVAALDDGFYFGEQSTNAALVKSNATVFIATGGNMSFSASVKIAGWNSGSNFLVAIPVQQVAYLKDVKPSGTSGGTFTAGAWQTRDLNTLEGDTGFVSLNGSNQFTLGKGKYLIEAEPTAVNVDRHKSAIYNVTGSSYVSYGSSEYSNNAGGDSSISRVVCSIEITSPTVFEIRHYGQTTQASSGFGIASSFGVNEVYTQVKITKIK